MPSSAPVPIGDPVHDVGSEVYLTPVGSALLERGIIIGNKAERLTGRRAITAMQLRVDIQVLLPEVQRETSGDGPPRASCGSRPGSGPRISESACSARA